MKRKEFLKTAVKASLLGAMAPSILKASESETKNPTQDKLTGQVGYNHLPNEKISTMNTIVHKANTRGSANHGWLNSKHSFSFANYYNPDRMNFGALRVLNDDIVQAGMGFGTHPHENMEIISIPLEGDLEHKDSMGNVAVIKEGDVQILSAGTGITHSEYNKNKDKEVKFLQIWVFPKAKNLKPRYDQISIREIAQENKFYQVISPNKNDSGIWINQDAWFSFGDFTKGSADEYTLKKEGQGVYAFVLKGEVEIEGQNLNERDGMGIWNTSSITVKAAENARVLLVEVPMLT